MLNYFERLAEKNDLQILLQGSWSELECKWWDNFNEMKKPIHNRDCDKLLDSFDQSLTLFEYIEKYKKA